MEQTRERRSDAAAVEQMEHCADCFRQITQIFKRCKRGNVCGACVCVRQFSPLRNELGELVHEVCVKDGRVKAAG